MHALPINSDYGNLTKFILLYKSIVRMIIFGKTDYFH